MFRWAQYLPIHNATYLPSYDGSLRLHQVSKARTSQPYTVEACHRRHDLPLVSPSPVLAAVRMCRGSDGFCTYHSLPATLLHSIGYLNPLLLVTGQMKYNIKILDVYR